MYCNSILICIGRYVIVHMLILFFFLNLLMSYWLKLEKFLDCRKLTFFTVEKIFFIQLLTLKSLRDILNLEQNHSSLAFFAVDKISIIFSKRLKHKY